MENIIAVKNGKYNRIKRIENISAAKKWKTRQKNEKNNHVKSFSI